MKRTNALWAPIFLALVALAPCSHAAPAMQDIPVAPSYLPYVGADNSATFDGDAYEKQRDKLGSPMSILTHGAQREREMKNGYVTVFATWAQTTLRVPLGWYAVESNENVDESLIFSPGQTVKIVARAAIENQKFQSDRNAFEKLKIESVGQTRARLQKMGLTAGPIERFDWPGEAFAVSVPRATDKAGHTFSYIERFSQRSPQSERDEFWRAMGTGKAMSPLQLPLGLSLLAPTDKFEKYLPLFGLMARDEGLNWAREFSLSTAEFKAQVPDAAKFNAVADEAIALIQAGDAAAFQKRFPTAFEGQSASQTAKYLTTIATPFFAKLPAKIERENISVVRERDPATPLRATIRRDFKLGENNFPSYVVAMESVGGKIELLGVATTDDPFAG